MVFDNIGIKHVFLCINICWAARGMLKLEPERRGFQPLPSLIVIIALGNHLTRNNVEIVSKRSFSIVFRMAPMLALLGGVLITLLSGHIQMSQ